MTDRSAGCWVLVFLLGLYAFTAGGHYGGDGFWSYLTAESIVRDGDLVLGNHPFQIKEMQHQYSAEGEGGVVAASQRPYSKYGLGLALVEVPFYAVGHLLCSLFPGVPRDYVTMWTTSMTNTVVCALWAVVFFCFTGRLGYNRPTRLWLTGIFGLGSLVFPYSGYGFSEPLIGLTLLGAVSALHRYRQSNGAWNLVVAGACLGLGAATKLYVLITIPFLTLYLWWPIRRRPLAEQIRTAVLFIAPLILFGILIAWYNWARYGSIFKTGYHLDDLVSEFWTGQQGGYFSFSPVTLFIALYGFLLSTGRGLLFFLPVVFLAPWGFLQFGRDRRPETLLFAILIVEHLLFFAGFRGWHGGSCWGPRYLLPAMPFLLLPLGALLKQRNLLAVPAKILGVLGAAVQFPAVLINYHFFIRFLSEHQIGDLIYFRGHPGDLLFSPGSSPILGAMYLLASALSRVFTGQSLHYPLPSWPAGQTVSMAPYDVIDIWWVNVLKTGFLGQFAVLTVVGTVLCAMLILALSIVRLHQWGKEHR